MSRVLEPAGPSMTLDAEIRTRLATAQLARFHTAGGVDNLLRTEESCWLDSCLTARPPNARACYVDRWSPQRFERIGRVFVLPPGQTMRAQSDGLPSHTSVVFHLRLSALQELVGGGLEWTSQRLEACLNIVDTNVQRLMLRLASELRAPGFASEPLVDLIAAQMAIELTRYCAAIGEASRGGGGLAPWRLRLIEEQLRDMRSAPSLSDLATMCKLSVRQLSRAFRESRGVAIGDYVAQCRLEHAKRLLLSEESIKAIASNLGFASQSSFSYAFRRATGQSPREFRTHMRRAT